MIAVEPERLEAEDPTALRAELSFRRLVDESAEVSLVAYSAEPVVQNRSEIEQLLVRSYPPALIRQGIGGVTLVSVLVDAEGRSREARVEEGSGYPELDAASHSVVMAMRFSPALVAGCRAPSWLSIPVRFTTQAQRRR